MDTTPKANRAPLASVLLDRLGWSRGAVIVQNTMKLSGASFALVLLTNLSATAIETPAARLYRAITDVCLDRYLSNNDLNTAQLNTGRPLIVQCDCIARFLFPYMDDEAARQFETRIPDKVKSNWDDAVLRCTNVILH
jgi:hypothetical protein